MESVYVREVQIFPKRYCGSLQVNWLQSYKLSKLEDDPTGVNILHKICNCSEADRNCSGALQRNFFADNWKGFITFCWNCYFYHTWFRFLLLSELKSGNSNRFVWKLVINTFILDLLCKGECLADVLASKLNLSTILQDSYLLLLEDSAFQLLNIYCYSTNYLE